MLKQANNKLSRLVHVLMFLSIFLVAGCAGLHTFPHMARAGDSVMLALGSAEGMTKDNITVTYLPDDGSGAVDLTPGVFSIFNMLPSNKAAVRYFDMVQAGAFDKSHEFWLTTMVMDLPVSMPVGTGKVTVVCAPRNSCSFPLSFGVENHVNDFEINLEIIAGQGVSHPFRFQAPDFSGGTVSLNVTPVRLEEMPQVVVRPAQANSISNTVFGAVSILLTVPTQDEQGSVPIDASKVRIVSEDLSTVTASQAQLNWSRAAGSDQFKISMVSPTGMFWQEISFSIVLSPPGSMINYGVPGANLNTFTGQPSIDSVIFYDLGGNPIAAVDSPTIAATLQNTAWPN